MDGREQLGITVKKEENFSDWYQQAVIKGQLAEYSTVKGFIILKPHGFAMWDAIRTYLDKRIKKIGVQNCYFPLLIPEPFFKKEAEHAEGFAPEVAWIANAEDGVRLAIRPTSETIMCDAFAKWVRSHRDLPLRINQWVNVVRWETKATRLFLRGREFLWQEGHCLYATKKQTDKEVMIILKEYQRLAEQMLAMPVIIGKKPKSETFAGALYSLSMEALMPDGKALQSATSHNLGQSFVKAFDISFLDEKGEKQLPWHTSWGCSTRLLGGVVMTHGDDKGLVLPPRIAPIQLAIVPILFDKTKEATIAKANELEKLLATKFRVVLDDRDGHSAGFKFNEWELKGVPLRLELGPKDLEKQQVVLVRRDTKEKHFVPFAEVETKIKQLLETIQQDLYARAKARLDSQIVEVDSQEAFDKAIADRKMVYIKHCGTIPCEEKIQEKTVATPRCIPFRVAKPEGKCVYCDKPAEYMVYFAKAY